MSRLDDRIARVRTDPARAARIDEIVAENMAAVTLEQLRAGQQLSQAAIAETLQVSQRRVSAIENQSNVMVGTLQDFVSALGYHLELVAVSDEGERIPLKLAGISA